MLKGPSDGLTKVIVQVKGGEQPNPKSGQRFRGDYRKRKHERTLAYGIFLSLEDPTKGMVNETIVSPVQFYDTNKILKE